MGKRHFWAAAFAILGACGNYPRDPERTLERVRDNRVFRVGLIDGDAANRRPAQMLIAEIADETGARPLEESGAAERLLQKLEEGELDLVVGTFDEKTPWTARIAIGPPVREQFEGRMRQQVAPAMRNGENAWIALVERRARDLAARAASQ